MEKEFKLGYDELQELFLEVSHKIIDRNLKIMRENLEGHILEDCDVTAQIKMNSVDLGNLETRVISNPTVVIHDQNNIWKDLKIGEKYVEELNYIIDFCKQRCTEYLDRQNEIHHIGESLKNRETENDHIKNFSDVNYCKSVYKINVTTSPDDWKTINIHAIFVIFFDTDNNFIDIVPNELIIISDSESVIEDEYYCDPTLILTDKTFDRDDFISCGECSLSEKHKSKDQNKTVYKYTKKGGELTVTQTNVENSEEDDTYIEIKYPKILTTKFVHNVDCVKRYLKEHGLSHLMLNDYTKFTNGDISYNKIFKENENDIIMLNLYWETYIQLITDIDRVGINKFDNEDKELIKTKFKEFFECTPCTKINMFRKALYNRFYDIFKEQICDKEDLWTNLKTNKLING